jgi:epoxyqueuosine reductase
MNESPHLSPAGKSEYIKKLACELGFMACGIGVVEELTRERERLESWLGKGYQGDMKYLETTREKRTNPSLLLEGARSIILLAYYYSPDKSFIPAPPYSIARFALGTDYHTVLKERVLRLVEMIQLKTGPFQYKVFSDSAPVMEKAWASRTGIGWIGKNTLLQLPGKGSWFLLSEIITDLVLEPDKPYTEQHCGNCRRCLDACPTGALVEPYMLNASKCLCYLNFDYEGLLPDDTDLHGRLYGCDLCQEVCPFNKSVPVNKDSWLKPKPILAELTVEEWEKMDKDRFSEIFIGSGISRLGYEIFKRNISLLKEHH